MRSISDTITRLSRYRQPAAFAGPSSSSLVELHNFGANPGGLRGWLHIPRRRPKTAALVVVLHGCTQTAAGYDHGSGWSELAEREGFVVLFPEQQRQNNANLCFNWFNAADIARGSGEALSIFQMIETVRTRQAIDPDRIFVTGLSAGGAMANVMLAAYPEVFAGGAIIAGLPYGAARSMPEAFERMRGHGGPNPAALAALVRRASHHTGPWPTVSIWQGDADATVSPANAEAIAAQWLGVHNLPANHAESATTTDERRRTWRNAEGRVVVEQIDIAGMGHGTPIRTSGKDACGAAGPFMLDVGISSTAEICRSWSLSGETGVFEDSDHQMQAAPSSEPGRGVTPTVNRAVFQRIVPEKVGATGVGQVIEDALRKAGLMR